MSFGEIMIEQMNNPECSFLSGMMVGNMFSIKNLFLLLLIMIIYKGVNHGVDRLIDFLKKKYKSHNLTKN
jgi:hypothetical protein